MLSLHHEAVLRLVAVEVAAWKPKHNSRLKSDFRSSFKEDPYAESYVEFMRTNPGVGSLDLPGGLQLQEDGESYPTPNTTTGGCADG
jgi:hypothetical protein